MITKHSYYNSQMLPQGGNRESLTLVTSGYFASCQSPMLVEYSLRIFLEVNHNVTCKKGGAITKNPTFRSKL